MVKTISKQADSSKGSSIIKEGLLEGKLRTQNKQENAITKHK